MTSLKGWSNSPLRVPPYYLTPSPPLQQGMPTGRLDFVPPFFTVTPTWESLLPPADQLILFDEVLLKRELIQQYIPHAIVNQWLVYIQPLLTYTRSHWTSQINRTLVGGSVHWYLFYGTIDDFGAIQFLDPGPDQTALSTALFDVDSSAGQGWLLCLANKLFALPTPPSPPVLSFHIYAAYALDQPPSPQPFVFFDPTVPSVWLPFQNLLNFPPHYLTLAPFQP